MPAIRMRAVAADGITPVNGATIAWSSSPANAVQFSACNGASSCSVLSDEAGESSSLVTPTVTGASTITVALAPASYSPPQSQQTTLLGTSSTVKHLLALTPTRWIAQAATIAVPLTVEALDLGVPETNVNVNFTITIGAASLSAGSATTNASALATVTAQLTNQNADVQVSAVRRSGECAVPDVDDLLHARFILEIGNSGRVKAGCANRTTVSTVDHAYYRWLARRESSDGRDLQL